MAGDTLSFRSMPYPGATANFGGTADFGGRADFTVAPPDSRGPPPSGAPGEFQKGLTRGTYSLQGGAYEAAGMAAQALGMGDTAAALRRDADAAEARAGNPALAPAVPSFRNIRSAPQFGQYVAGTLGELAPSVAGMAGGALAGGALAGPPGALVGGFAGSAIPSTGDVYREVRERTGPERPGLALATGSAIGALDMLPAVRAVRGVFPGAGAARKSVGRVVGGAVLGEGATEGTQEGLQMGAVSYADPSIPFLSEENAWRGAEATVKGSIGGAAFGSGAALSGKVADLTQQGRDALAGRPQGALGPPEVDTKQAGESKGMLAMMADMERHLPRPETTETPVRDEELDEAIRLMSAGRTLTPEEAGFLDTAFKRVAWELGPPGARRAEPSPGAAVEDYNQFFDLAPQGPSTDLAEDQADDGREVMDEEAPRYTLAPDIVHSPYTPEESERVQRLDAQIYSAADSGYDTQALEAERRLVQRRQDDASIFKSRPPTHSPYSVLPGTFNGTDGYFSVPQLTNAMFAQVQTEDDVARGTTPPPERILQVFLEGMGALAEHEGVQMDMGGHAYWKTLGERLRKELGASTDPTERQTLAGRIQYADSQAQDSRHGLDKLVVFKGHDGVEHTFGSLVRKGIAGLTAKINSAYKQSSVLNNNLSRWRKELESAESVGRREVLGRQIANAEELAGRLHEELLPALHEQYTQALEAKKALADETSRDPVVQLMRLARPDLSDATFAMERPQAQSAEEAWAQAKTLDPEVERLAQEANAANVRRGELEREGADEEALGVARKAAGGAVNALVSARWARIRAYQDAKWYATPEYQGEVARQQQAYDFGYEQAGQPGVGEDERQLSEVVRNVKRTVDGVLDDLAQPHTPKEQAALVVQLRELRALGAGAQARLMERRQANREDERAAVRDARLRERTAQQELEDAETGREVLQQERGVQEIGGDFKTDQRVERGQGTITHRDVTGMFAGALGNEIMAPDVEFREEGPEAPAPEVPDPNTPYGRGLLKQRAVEQRAAGMRNAKRAAQRAQSPEGQRLAAALPRWKMPGDNPAANIYDKEGMYTPVVEPVQGPPREKGGAEGNFAVVEPQVFSTGAGGGPLRRIISGGQTGADRAGLDVGRTYGLLTGGYAPKGFRTDAGANPALADYGLVEDGTSGYIPRTKKNVLSADGTVAFLFGESTGTTKTVLFARTGVWYTNTVDARELWKSGELRSDDNGVRPVLIIHSKNLDKAPQLIAAFVARNNIRTLNVAGHRERTMPGTYGKVTEALSGAIERMRQAEKVQAADVKNAPMYYEVPPEAVRADLREAYPQGTTTAQLMNDGRRTAITRKPFAAVGQVVSFKDGVKGLWRVTAVERPDLASAEGRTKWEAREGWDLTYVERNPKLRAHVFSPNVVQTVLERVGQAQRFAARPKVPAKAEPVPPKPEPKGPFQALTTKDIQAKQLRQLEPHRAIYKAITGQEAPGDLKPSQLVQAARDHALQTRATRQLQQLPAALKHGTLSAEQRGQRQARRNRVVREGDDLLTAVAKLGGISKADAVADGFDPVDISKARSGILHAFHRKGESFDGMREKLAEEGWEFETEADLSSALQDALRGVPQHAQGDEAAFERMREAYLSAQRDQDDDAALSLGFTPYKVLQRGVTIEDVQGHLDTWAKQLKLPVKLEALTLDEARDLAPQVGIEGFERLVEFGELHGYTSPVQDGTIKVFIHPGLTGELRREIIAHEGGHAVFRAAVHGASEADAKAILDDFAKWRGKAAQGTVEQLIVGKKPAQTQLLYLSSGLGEHRVSSLPEPLQSYMLDFEEWFADRASAVLNGRALDKGPVQRFFQRLVDWLKGVFGAGPDAVQRFIETLAYGQPKPLRDMNPLQVLRGVKADLTHSILTEDGPEEGSFKLLADALNSTNKAATSVMPTDISQYVMEFAKEVKRWTGKAPSLEDIKEAVIGAFVVSHDPYSAAATEALRQNVLHFTSVADRNAIANMVFSPHVQQQLRTLVGDELKTLEADADAAFAAMYQFWLAGKMTLTPAQQGLVGKVKDRIANTLGYVADTEVANKVFTELRAGLRTWQALGETHGVVQRRVAGTIPQLVARTYDKAWETGVGKGLEGLLSLATTRIRGFGVPALTWVDKQVHTKAGDSTSEDNLFAARTKQTARFIGQLNQALAEESPETIQEALEGLYGTKPMGPQATKVASKMRSLLEGMYEYAHEVDPTLRHRKDYFPWVINSEKLARDPGMIEQLATVLSKPEYAQGVGEIFNMLKEGSPLPRNKGDTHYYREDGTAVPLPTDPAEFPRYLAERLVDLGGLLDVEISEVRYKGPVSGIAIVPSFRFANKRMLDFIKPEDMRPFLADDLVEVMGQYLSSMVKRIEFDRKFGREGKLLRDKLVEATAQGATPEQLELVRDHINTVLGTHGRRTAERLEELTGGKLTAPKTGKPINQGLQDKMAAVMVYENVRLLALATVSSIVDPLGIAVRMGPRHMLHGVKQLIRDVKERHLDKKGQHTVLQSLGDMLGVTEKEIIRSSVVDTYASNFMRGRAKRINDGFFRWTGLQAWTRNTRLMALAAAENFLKFHGGEGNAHTARYLAELGLSKEDIAEGNSSQKVRAALRRLVDEAILRPAPTQRPVWGSDPHWMLFFHMKSYMYSFHDRVLKRAAHEIGNGNYMALAALGMYLPVMFVGEVIRAAAKGDDDWFEKKADWSIFEWMDHLADRAGLYGLWGLVNNAITDVKMGGAGVDEFLGPVVDQLENFSVSSALPLQNVLKNWAGDEP